MKPRRLFILAAGVGLLWRGTCRGGSGKGTIGMYLANMREHCFGRHLVRLPVEAEVEAEYRLDGGILHRANGLLAADLDQLRASKQTDLELPTKQAKSGRSVLSQVLDPSSRAFTLIYSADDGGRFTKTQETFWVAADRSRVYRHVSRLDAGKEALSIDLAKQFQARLYPRAQDEVFGRPGFCIDGAVVEGSRTPYQESYSVVVRFPTLPRVTLTISSEETGRPQEPLFDRMPGGLAALAGLAAGMRTLRKREFQLGGQKAQEMLLRIPAEGKRAYHFQLEAPGVADSTADPYIVIELNTTHTLDADGHVGDAAFRDDDEALAFWDAIVQSFRLRPGAV